MEKRITAQSVSSPGRFEVTCNAFVVPDIVCIIVCIIHSVYQRAEFAGVSKSKGHIQHFTVKTTQRIDFLNCNLPTAAVCY